MDRREFLKTTFAASAATVTLGRREKTHVDFRDQVDIERVAHAEERQASSTTVVDTIAQHLLVKIAERLDVEAWVTTLCERNGEPLWRQGGPADQDAADGHGVGYTVLAYEPGVERFEGPQHVTLGTQVSAVWEVPKRFTGGRREFYDPSQDVLRNGPAVEALPIRLDQLTPVIEMLARQILDERVNVFSPGLFMPLMSGSVEGAVVVASRTYGLALRVVRCLGLEHALMMRADLLGGTFLPNPSTRA